jgi:nucleolin
MAYTTTEDTLRSFFGKAGMINGLRIAMDADGYPKGFCHIDFDSEEGAQAAAALTGSDLDGRQIMCEMA